MTTTLTLPHVVASKDAERIWDWLTTRGGLALWKSQNLSNPGASWTAPRCDQYGNVKVQGPNWQCAYTPYRIITDPDEVMVVVDREVKRFKIHTRMGSQGLTLKLTDASSRRVEREVAKAGEGAHYVFDYATDEAVILVPESEQTLKSWAHERGLI